MTRLLTISSPLLALVLLSSAATACVQQEATEQAAAQAEVQQAGAQQTAAQHDAIQQAAAHQTSAELRVHEWGVWLLERNNVTVEELAAEVPAFVVRARESSDAPAEPPPIDFTHDDPFAREPVLFFYASRPLSVEVTVDFPRGEPWLLYPPASDSQRRSLTWRGLVGGEGSAPAVGPNHWWQSLRDVGSDGFRNDQGQFEHFIFYDGVTSFRRRLNFSSLDGSEPPVIRQRDGAEEPVFLVSPAGFGVYEGGESRRAPMVESERGPLSGLLDRVRPELLDRGLSEAEADALLEVWGDRLIGPAGDDTRITHAVYFVSREDYDRMLPITISPEPTSLVRVGVAIQRFEQ